jgi:hypothetical protein
MVLLVVYVILIIVGDLVAYTIGLAIERPQLFGLGFERPSSTASLTIFLACYFLNLWIAWVLAVKMTAPKSSQMPA